jgi:hypothetical protein
MRIFIAKEDINIFGCTIVKQEQMIKFLDDETTHKINTGTTTMDVTLEQLTNDSRFEEVKLLPVEEKKELNFTIDEIPDEEDLEVKRFRIQLDVTTNRKKLREIENFMRKTLEEML